jgi:hypothetical protein
MYAKNLSLYLHQELAEPGTYDETLKRFESLRGYGRLPRGRENAGLRLSDEHIASAILGFVPILPGWAGHVSLIVGDLRPVGGTKASFQEAETLEKALAILIKSEEACNSIVHVALCIARKMSSDNYYATLMFEKAGARQTTSFVSKMAYSLMGDGVEKNYDHEELRTGSARQLVLGRDFFKKIGREIATSRHLNMPFKTDWREYETEEERESFHRSLGACNSSRFLNVGVDTQVTWPKEPTRVQFAGHHLVLFPKTKENSHSISVDLMHERLSDDEASTLINRFLTLLCWCDDQHAILHDGWSGNPIPVPVTRRNLAFATTPNWYFNRSLPDDEDLLQRLAYYREGLNAREASISSYEVLSFFKVFEVRRRSKGSQPNPTKLWIAKVFDDATQSVQSELLERFHTARGLQNVEDYICENNRVATAHASEKHPSDADSSLEISRLYVSAEVMRALARYYIRNKFRFSESYLSDAASGSNNKEENL